MNKLIQRTDAISKADNLIKNSNDFANIKLRRRSDLKSFNKSKESDMKSNKKMTDLKNCKSKDLNDINGYVNYKIKDRGDLKLLTKSNDSRIKRDDIVKHKIINPDGDTQNISVKQRSEKTKINESSKQLDVKNTENLKSFWNKRTVRNDQILANVDLKRIRDKYTVKLRNPNRPTVALKKEENNIKTEPKNVPTLYKKENKRDSIIIHIPEELPHFSQKTQNLPQIPQKIYASPNVTQKIHENITQNIQELPQIAQKTQDLPQIVQKKHDLQLKNEKEAKKKPVIRTIMSKNGSTRIYKAVTFEELKMKPPSLKINIPNDPFKKPNSIKSIDVNSLKSKQTVSKISVKEKQIVPKKCFQKRGKKYKRHFPSRDCSVQDILTRSPPTEVAKWAPTSITPQTRPYYEAWVDTTLTAVTKSDRLNNENMSLLKSLEEALERSHTPELFYCNYADERYAGRIKIHTR